MIGGIVVQILGDKIEVLDTTTFDRLWRRIALPTQIKEQDGIRWQNYTAYLSRGKEFRDKNIGFCFPSDKPRKPNES